MPFQFTINYETLCQSKAFTEFTAVLSSLAGMPTALYGTDCRTCFTLSPQTSYNPICQLIRQSEKGLAQCLVSEQARFAQVLNTGKSCCCLCHAGLLDIAIPIHHNGKIIAIISSGQLLPEPPNEERYAAIASRCVQYGIAEEQVHQVYYTIPYLDKTKVDSIIKLITVFAGYLCETSQLQLDTELAQCHPLLVEAQEYIRDHVQENLSLPLVAGYVQLSPSHLGKLFKSTLGLSFTEYVQHARVERAKALLKNPALPITEIAFLCGFNCLSQFNRTFRRLDGGTPREYRRRCTR